MKETLDKVLDALLTAVLILASVTALGLFGAMMLLAIRALVKYVNGN